MILLNLERTSNKPLFRQIFEQLKARIEDATLSPGFRMPSTRVLAEKHGVNRSTVVKAYEELWAMGYVESRPGSYSVVRKRQQIALPGDISAKGLIPWEEKSSDAGRALHSSYRRLTSKVPASTPGKVVNMAPLDLDARVFPVEDFRRCLNTVLVEQGGEILKYGECEGYRPLREVIAARLRVHGISVNWDEILVTNGSQNAIELVLKLLTVPGTPVAVEAPTYSHMLPLLDYFKLDVIDIPMTKSGMDLDVLEQVLGKNRPAFVYTIPNFHNPTGITMDHANRERLLALCETCKVPIIEDAFEEEMKYFGKVPLPIKSMDRQHLVLYLGTFSKVLFPGIRVGWIAAEKESIRRLAAIKKFSDLSTSTLIQAALHEFCQEGYYDRHIKRMHREYRKRMNTALSAMKKHLGQFPAVSWNEPAGGYLIWFRLTGTHMDTEQLRKIFVKHGVVVVPGNNFYSGFEIPVTIPDAQFFRISISTLDEQEIGEGISRIGKAIAEIYE
jgi:DNA-binding transcriptional MocR family regulator